MRLDAWVRGGVELESFTIDESSLLSNEEITVAFVDFGLPTSYTELEEISNSMGSLEQSSLVPYFD